MSEDAPEETPAPAQDSGLSFHGPPAPLLAALAEAQAAFATVGRGQVGQTGHRKFRYADLESLIEATRPILKEHGLSVLQGVGTDDAGKLVITTCLGHKTGSLVTATVRVDPGETSTKDGVQWCGALTTYWRRFQYRSLLCLADGEDLDSADAPNAAARRETTSKPPANPGAASSKASGSSPSAARASGPSLAEAGKSVGVKVSRFEPKEAEAAKVDLANARCADCDDQVSKLNAEFSLRKFKRVLCIKDAKAAEEASS